MRPFKVKREVFDAGIVAKGTVNKDITEYSADEVRVFKNYLITFEVVESIEDMALEIKATPILTGESATRFIEIVEKNQDNRISASKKEEMRRRAQQVLKKAKI